MHFFSAVVLFVCMTGVSSVHGSGGKPPLNPPTLSDQRLHPVVIGGYAASMEEFPYALRVYISAGRMFIFCTGEAVHRKLVMTAAHCVYNSGNIIVVTGSAEQEDFVNGRNLHKYARYKITQVFIHPQFDKVQYVNDIALLKTGRPMLHPGHEIIRISYDRLTRPVDATIYGWGGTEFQEKNNQLFGKRLKAGNCSLKPYPNLVHQYFCLLEKGICHGDSGGGLIINNSIYGVASFYQKHSESLCGEDDLYYYTAMAEVREFVSGCIAKNGSDDDRPFSAFILKCIILHLLLK